MSAFTPVTGNRVADQVAGALRESILRGDYPPGQRLPAERELASQFDVNRSSVREAVTRLEAWGLVEVRHGGGATVTNFLTASGLHLLPWLLAPNGNLDPHLMRDLLTVRVALLEFTAREAAVHATPVQVTAMRTALAALEAARGADQIQVADFTFFETLVAASGNRVLGLMLTAIGAAYSENRTQFAALYPDDQMVTVLHQVTVEAVDRADPEAAAQAMKVYAQTALVVFENE